jgi:hypothetical protein
MERVNGLVTRSVNADDGWMNFVVGPGRFEIDHRWRLYREERDETGTYKRRG